MTKADEEHRILHLNALHVPEKIDDLNWRNSKEGKEYFKKYGWK